MEAEDDYWLPPKYSNRQSLLAERQPDWGIEKLKHEPQDKFLVMRRINQNFEDWTKTKAEQHM